MFQDEMTPFPRGHTSVRKLYGLHSEVDPDMMAKSFTQNIHRFIYRPLTQEEIADKEE